MSKTSRKIIGDWGEKQAEKFLERKDFKILGRNYHTVDGEIDIVAKKGEDYYFVEVKTRPIGETANNTAITRVKQKRMEKAVKKYCCRYDIDNDSAFLAGIIVAFDKKNKKAHFHFCLLY